MPCCSCHAPRQIRRNINLFAKISTLLKLTLYFVSSCSCSHIIKCWHQNSSFIVRILINIHIFTSPDSSFTEATNIHQTLFIQDKVEKSLKQEQDKRSEIAELLDCVSYHYIWTHIYLLLHQEPPHDNLARLQFDRTRQKFLFAGSWQESAPAPGTLTRDMLGDLWGLAAGATFSYNVTF